MQPIEKQLFPVLEREIRQRHLRRKDIAAQIGISAKAFEAKRMGRSPFLWKEVQTMQHCFFSNVHYDVLMFENKYNEE